MTHAEPPETTEPKPDIDALATLQTMHEDPGLTWRQLGRLCGVSERAIHHWRAGGRVSEFHLGRLARIAAETQTLPGDTPDERYRAMVAPGEAGQSIYDTLRAEVTVGERVIGAPYSAKDLLLGES